MLTGSLGLDIVCFVAVAYTVVSLCKPLFSPLRNIPGPFAARFTNLWYFRRMLRGQFQHDNISLHQKYGPIVRYGPNRYSFNDPSAAGTIYAIGTGAQFAKSTWYETFGQPGEHQWTLFSDLNIKRHAQNRKLFSSMYAMSSLVSYEAYVDECADVFSQRLQELSTVLEGNQKEGLFVNMGHWFQCYAFDVIGLITYSKRLGFLDQGEDVGGIIAALETHLLYSSLVGIYSSLHNFLYHLLNWCTGGSGTAREYVVAFTKECVRKHESEPKALDMEKEDHETMDFLSKAIARNRNDPERFTNYHTLAACVSNMAAGSDTTAISLSAILFYLLRNPDSMRKLQQEVDIYQAELGSSPNIPFKVTSEMPYLQAVMKEALRMHPATGLPLERVVPKGGSSICGRFFPEGTIVGINTWVEHRNPQIFGADANSFKPERWLTEDASQLAMMNRHWMPFGAGSRTCIGRHISILEMSKLIPRLVRDFDFELNQAIATNEKSWKTTTFWFVKPRDFEVKIRRRGHRETTEA
ncbi:cytochrome P450 [Xylariaceae sp. FL0016]|nr:cytochrome P450 [Xylariaceae sp. FL0016]